ncbi:cobyrinate a,c-diamide synthase [Pseudohoeflea suaedae]|uniref:Hydrogenobyrinate a,c-diamide synthase n=1 Tax=Pseudohoeflea suaedae TaxID=877384 RepID=A0A4R5PJG9_9HYPH|nr:cobyrinate a,c-diamide synthase [Pseudohoeflea suaedae]TDH35809.1 cobyrinate a,c-diamide synthase [Pseudohoeflea suaedae]
MKGVMLAAPQSGSGKTTITLGLLRALKRRGEKLAPAKAGPDYIDPAFHSVASGAVCMNYDPWAMRPDFLRANASLASEGGRIFVLEAMMGLYDGAADGTGSSADLARLLGLPVILVIDCAKLSHSVAAIARGFSDFSPDLYIGGVILNRVGSERHERMLRSALEHANVDCLGAMPRDEALVVPERHLGLVQAGENTDLEAFVDAAAVRIERHVDVGRIGKLARLGTPFEVPANILRLPPLGQRIAIARDLAFAFSYEHMLLSWRRRGAELSFFSPLADEAPAEDADAVFLPGGYPELHAGRIAGAATFKDGMTQAVARGVRVYGECGGYMVLGEGLIDAEGTRHEMLGALPLMTSYAERRRSLGYRRIQAEPDFIWPMPLRAHEFHYSTVVEEGAGEALFSSIDAEGNELPKTGLRRGNVAGSYMHVIDMEA